MARPVVAPPKLHAAAERVGRIEAVDPIAKKVAKAVRDAIPDGTVKDAVSGTWLGHALHPLITDVVIGPWTSALILDAVGGEESEKAADVLIGVGIAASVPTAVSGLNDWADTEVADDSIRRVGAVHGALNTTALALFTASLAARRGGRRGAGKVLAAAGGAVLAVSGHLGGHLSYSQGVGVEQTAFDAGPEDWAPTIPATQLADGAATRVLAGGTRVLLVRDGGTVYALHNRCSHRGGPLDEGEISDGCVTCPWHRSRFRLSDGAVMQGPATGPQPALDVREREGWLEVRART
ncbi:MAG: Rieske (2Fe-2S) protein [Actinomycetota bacterium]|nr:Rieske (2Fe-2S) protein [Actinomycetota bacterium]MDQ5808098.1 Rieske (2Fe-2S) protein [Actinomycetota bacterium]